ncbi:hypothetical protein [Nostoc sp. ChiSLP03a]|uniref:hypothetical protein n=1 Tax=Nostoc sp. ChiSLP03a TaxID=3075380 RepID=UPI002AD37A57|nr:hypothetical protein [Nostoc sp. ChiSLP03a]MDZ8213941.1 hypothetical protein [Nostoc sp. ChiSLP03a]
MNTLIEYYKQRESQLKSLLNEANTPGEVVEIIQNEIDKLADNNGEYIRGLALPQIRRVARKYLIELKPAINLLATLRPEDSTLNAELNHSTQPNYHQSYPLVIAIAGTSGLAVILVNIVRSLLIKDKEQQSILLNDFSNKLQNICPPLYPNISKQFPDFSTKLSDICTEVNDLQIKLDSSNLISPFFIGLIFALFAIITAIFFLRAKKKIQTSYKTTNLEVRNNQISFNGVDEILNFLLDKFTTIDNEIAKESNQTEFKPPVPKLEDHSDLLEYLQNLLGVASREQTEIPTSTNKRIDEIRDFLDFQGMNVEFYQHGVSDPSKFQFLPSGSSEAKEYITLKPAFIKNEQVLLRGRVVKPES